MDLILQNNDFYQSLCPLAYYYKFDLVHDKRYTIRSVGGYALSANVVSDLKKMIKQKNSFKLRIENGPPETFLSFFGLQCVSNWV